MYVLFFCGIVSGEIIKVGCFIFKNNQGMQMTYSLLL
jgi:hypothetical protein